MQARALMPPRDRSLGVRWSVFQRRYAPYIFISPFFILFAVFQVYPILFSLYLSLHSWNPVTGLSGMKFVGTENYTFTLTDRLFWQALGNTVYIGVASGLPQHLIAIPLAFALNTGLRRAQHLLSAVYFLPFITSIVSISLIFTVLFSWQYGMINQIILSLNQLPVLGWLLPDERVNFLDGSNLQNAISGVVVWRYFGWNTVIYLAGIQAIPRDYYEAAQVDGAGTWHQFRFITLPLLRPIMFFAVTLTLIGNMQLFAEPFNLAGAQAGPNNVAQTLAFYLYRTAFQYNDFGTAAALSWVIFAIIAALTFVTVKVFGRGARGEGN